MGAVARQVIQLVYDNTKHRTKSETNSCCIYCKEQRQQLEGRTAGPDVGHEIG